MIYTTLILTTASFPIILPLFASFRKKSLFSLSSPTHKILFSKSYGKMNLTLVVISYERLV